MSCGGCCKEDAADAPPTKQCCVCHPYQDAYLMTAQILSIVAFCISWVWWVILILALPVMIALQVVWCCKMKKCGLKFVLVLSLLSAIASLFAGIWMLIKWKDQNWCSVFTLTMTYDDDDDYFRYGFNSFNMTDDNLGNYTFPVSTGSDTCNEVVWAIISFINSALFFATTYFMYLFIFQSFDKIIANEANSNIDVECPNEIELGPVSPVVAPLAAAPAVASGLDEPAVATATYYIPPDGAKSENTGY